MKVQFKVQNLHPSSKPSSGPNWSVCQADPQALCLTTLLYCLSIFYLWWQVLFPSSISITVRREASLLSWAPSYPALCLFFLCLFLSSAAGSLFTASSWREFFLWMATKDVRERRGERVTLWLTVVTSDLLGEKLPQGLVAIQWPLQQLATHL